MFTHNVLHSKLFTEILRINIKPQNDSSDNFKVLIMYIVSLFSTNEFVCAFDIFIHPWLSDLKSHND